MPLRRSSFFSLILLLSLPLWADSWDIISLGRLRYQGGGDWYSNPSSLPNLMKYCSERLSWKMPKRESVVSLSDDSHKSVPILYFTGHGKFSLTAKEKTNLRWFLQNGGFLFADDNFGMDKFIRTELNSLFPGTSLVELPVNHPVFRSPFELPGGLPKIHKHYGGPAQAYALFLDGRMVAFYGYNTDLGDGWEDTEVHKTPAPLHELALRTGCNVLSYALRGGR